MVGIFCVYLQVALLRKLAIVLTWCLFSVITSKKSSLHLLSDTLLIVYILTMYQKTNVTIQDLTFT